MSKQIVSEPGDSSGRTKPEDYAGLYPNAHTSVVQTGWETEGTMPNGGVQFLMAHESAEQGKWRVEKGLNSVNAEAKMVRMRDRGHNDTQ
jgi:hypothetical protein